MIKAAILSTSLSLLVLTTSLALAQQPAEQPVQGAETPAAPPPAPARVIVPTAAPMTDQQAAVAESVRRQAAKITLRQKINEARAAEARRDLPLAAKLYSDCWDLIISIGTDVDQEAQIVRAGADNTRMALAYEAQRAGDLHAADRN